MRFHVSENLKTPPQFQLGLRPIAENTWLLPDDGASFLPEKQGLIDNAPVFAALPQSLPAQSEAAEMIAAHIGVNYSQDEPALKAIARHISDDLIIMEKNEGDGAEWHASALCLCSPTFFDAEYALGKSLWALHEPIPSGNLDLSGRIARIFDNLQSDKVLERFNWTVQWSDRRYTPDGAVLRQMAAHAKPDTAAQMLFERVERQTIRKLPHSGALLFTIRIRLCPVREILGDAVARQYFINAWRNAPENLRQYKKWAHLEHHVNYLIEHGG